MLHNMIYDIDSQIRFVKGKIPKDIRVSHLLSINLHDCCENLANFNHTHPISMMGGIIPLGGHNNT